mgnify:CR=1 FL=1|tara:strand:+ start:21 stop:467 length:447 start_codon:yes stop_codon:yes gene_type:complete
MIKKGTDIAHLKASSNKIKKSSNAFLTISEVSEELKLPQHVLRFWETKFPSLKPMKRGGGRRYYRPKDIAFIKQIRKLLYTNGYTIKGVQKLLSDSDIKISPEITNKSMAQSIENTVDEKYKDLHSILEELINIRDELHKTHEKITHS